MSTEISRHKLAGPSATWTRPSSLQGCIHKVNRLQARQGELRSKRRCPGVQRVMQAYVGWFMHALVWILHRLKPVASSYG